MIMRKAIALLCLIFSINVHSQDEVILIDSSCNEMFNNLEDIKCWFKNSTIANDINMLVSDSCIHSVNVSNTINLRDIQIIDIKLNNSRPSIYNSHIYCLINKNTLTFVNCDSMWVDNNKIYTLKIIRNKLISESYLFSFEKITTLRSTILWENSDCETIDFTKSITHIMKIKNYYLIKLFIYNDCKDITKVLEKKWK